MCSQVMRDGFKRRRRKKKKKQESAKQVKAHLSVCTWARVHVFWERDLVPAVVSTLSSCPHLRSLLLY